ncbi:MAG: GAF domain-containing protein, partial [Chloroflexi bacterium]|nr:GAF domain-containing protein [Chloroflexota bacterium]
SSCFIILEFMVGSVDVTTNVAERKQVEDVLRDSEQELTKHQDRLEKLVEDRTAELKAVNERLQQEIAERKRAEDELRKARDDLSSLLELVQAASSSLEPGEVLQLVAKGMAKSIGVHTCGIYLVDQEKGLLFPAPGTGDSRTLDPDFSEAYRTRPLDPRDDGFVRQVLECKEPLVCYDAQTDPRTNKETARMLGLKSILAVPFVAKGRVVAVAMVVTFDDHYRFTEKQIDLARGIANSAAIAIENARLYREEQERHREDEQRRRVAESLRGILAVLNSSRPLSEILDYIVDQARWLLGSDAGLICRLQDDQQVLRIQSARGLGAEFTPEVTVRVGEGVIGRAVLTRQPVTVPDVIAALSNEDSLTQDPACRPYMVSSGIRNRAMLAVPLIVKDKVYGGITLYYKEPREFSAEEIELAAAFADQAALAIENARLRGQAEESAAAAERSRLARDLHDAVTQTLFSASLIAEVLPRLWERSPDEARRRLEELRQLTRGALAEMRTLLLELRPAALTEVALAELLRQLAEAITGRARVPVSVEIEGECQAAPEVQVALYRIAQEALNNVAKHAAANRASVSLRCQPGRVELCVRDDGKGVDLSGVAPGHLGLDIMNERAEAIGATLSLTSRPGHGTQVLVVWQEP